MHQIPSRLRRPPVWLSKTDCTVQEIAADLIAINFWSNLGQTADSHAQKNGSTPFAEARKLIQAAQSDSYVLARLLATGSDLSYDAAAFLEENMDAVQTAIAIYINEEGLLPYLEYANIGAYLLDKQPEIGEGKEKPGHYYDRAFMIEVLLPILGANGFPRDLALSVKDKFSKARVAVPYLREFLRDITDKAAEIKALMDATDDEEEKRNLEKALDEAYRLDDRMEKGLRKLMEEIVYGKSSVSEFQEEMRRIKYKTKPPDKMHGTVYNLSKGGVLMISCTDTKTLNALKLVCQKFVDWHLGDPVDMARQASHLIMKQELGKK